nr:Ig-like domain-containing protein [Myxococcales bacterium]
NRPIQLAATAMRFDQQSFDATQLVTWTSSDETIVTVSNGENKGFLSPGLLAGVATITASLGNVIATTNITHETPSRGFSSYRIHFDAVHGNLGYSAITGIDLVVNNEVLENLMESDDSGTIGPYTATVASSSDTNSYHAFDASLSSTWFSDVNTFVTEEPYTTNGEPVYLEINFEQALPVEGIRIHRTQGINPASYKAQFPRQIRVQGSLDGVEFSDINDANITLENWNGEVAELNWSVP